MKRKAKQPTTCSAQAKVDRELYDEAREKMREHGHYVNDVITWGLQEYLARKRRIPALDVAAYGPTAA